MALTSFAESFIDLDRLVLVRFESGAQGTTAFLRFEQGSSETVVGQSAERLLEHLSGTTATKVEAPSERDESEEILQEDESEPSKGDRAYHIDLSGVDFSVPLGLGRNKAWFYKKDERSREYFLAFVNAKGSCSVRSFDARTGIFLGKHYRSGSYQTQFADLINDATELTIDSQPNLERDCKERLPVHILQQLRDQV